MNSIEDQIQGQGVREGVREEPRDGYEGLLAATTRRLRLLQVDLAEQGDAVRRQSLAEEVGRALAAVAPDRRRDFLEQLSQRFPTWDGKEHLTPPKLPFDERKLKDRQFLVSCLAELAPGLNEQGRQDLAEALRAKGVLPPPPPPVIETVVVEKPVDRIVEKIVEKPVDRVVEKIVEKPVERVVEKIVEIPVERVVEKIVEKPVDRVVEKIVEKPVDRVVERIVEKIVPGPPVATPAAAAGTGGPTGTWCPEATTAPIRTRLQLAALDPDRAVQLLDMLLEFALNLDQFVWGTWRSVNPETAIRRPTALLKSTRAFLSGEGGASGAGATSRKQLEEDVRALRALTAALVSAASDVGHKFSSDFAERFSPMQIEEYVKARGVPTFRNFHALCWQKYVDLATSLEAAVVEKEINDVIAKLVEDLVSPARSPGAGRAM